jgi:hypothetical protein
VVELVDCRIMRSDRRPGGHCQTGSCSMDRKCHEEFFFCVFGSLTDSPRTKALLTSSLFLHDNASETS